MTPTSTASNTTPNEILSALEELETTFVDYDGHGDNPLMYHRGRIPVLITAPHGTRHCNLDGRWFPEEEYTSAMAMYVAKASGAYALCAVRKIKPDPNAYISSVFRNPLSYITEHHNIRLVIDLHGAAGGAPCGAALVTRRCPTYAEQAISVFEEAGWTRGATNPLYRLATWPGGETGEISEHCGTHLDAEGLPGQEALTGYASERCGVEAVLVTANPHCLVARRREDSAAYKDEGPFEGDPELIAAFAGALIRLVEIGGGGE